MNEIYYDANAVARLLGVTPTRVRQLVAQGAIPATRIGTRILIPRLAFDQWVATLNVRATMHLRALV